MSLSSTLALNLECPVCMEVPRDFPIYQCNNGHLLCKSCRDQLKTCPVCKIRLRYTRNLAVEKILENLPVPCKFERYGCLRELVKVERVKHEKICELREVRCPYLECRNFFSVARLVQHLPEHSIATKTFKGASNLCLTVEEDSFGHQDLPNLYWKPQRMDFKDRMFFVAEKKDYKTGLFYIWVYIIGTPEQATEFTTKIKVFGPETDKLSFTCPVVSIDLEEHEVLNTGAVLAFPDIVAKRLLFQEDRHLKVRVELVSKIDQHEDVNIVQTNGASSQEAKPQHEVLCALSSCSNKTFELDRILEHEHKSHGTNHLQQTREGETFKVSYEFKLIDLISSNVDVAFQLKQVRMFKRVFYILAMFSVAEGKFFVWLCIVRRDPAEKNADGGFEYEVSIDGTADGSPQFKSRQQVALFNPGLEHVISQQRCCVIPKEKVESTLEFEMSILPIRQFKLGTKKIKLSP